MLCAASNVIDTIRLTIIIILIIVIRLDIIFISARHDNQILLSTTNYYEPYMRAYSNNTSGEAIGLFDGKTWAMIADELIFSVNAFAAFVGVENKKKKNMKNWRVLYTPSRRNVSPLKPPLLWCWRLEQGPISGRKVRRNKYVKQAH